MPPVSPTAEAEEALVPRKGNEARWWRCCGERRKEEAVGSRLAVGLSIATIGCASLYAWNAIITSSSYYEKMFCGGALARSYESVFSVTYQATSLAATVYAARTTEEVSASRRVLPRLWGLSGLFGILTVLACFPAAPRDAVFAPVTLAGVALCGGLSQALCAALYGISTALPVEFMSWNMAGQAIGGLVPALIVVAEDLAAGAGSKNHDDDESDDDDGGCHHSHRLDPSVVGYFLAASALFLASVAAFGVLERQPLYRAAVVDVATRRALSHQRAESDERSVSRRHVSESADDVADRENENCPGDAKQDQVDQEDQGVERRSERRSGDVVPLLLRASQDLECDDAHNVGSFAHLLVLSRAVAAPAAAVFIVFAVTLASFPTLTALARASGHADDDDGDGSLFRTLFVPLLFLEFNFADFLGRSNAGLFADSLGTRPKLLFALALARIGFLPLILFGTLNGSSLSGPAFLKASPAPFVVMFPFALSNGLIATLAMAAAGPLAPKAHKELVGNLMSFYLTAGLAAGSALSFAMLAII